MVGRMQVTIKMNLHSGHKISLCKEQEQEQGQRGGEKYISHGEIAWHLGKEGKQKQDVVRRELRQAAG